MFQKTPLKVMSNEVEEAYASLENKNPLAQFMPKPQVEYPEVEEKNKAYLKKVYVQTWGCQMNVADTERMLALLGRLNYRQTESPKEADFILLNTCHIREKARHKLVSRLGTLRKLKEVNPDLVLAVTGCVAQAEAKIIAKEAPYVDLIFGPDQIEDVPQLLETAIKRSEAKKEIIGYKSSHLEEAAPFLDTKFKKSEGYSIPVDDVPPLSKGKDEVSRYVNIVKGCNNYCTFCVVPYTRGREKSRAEVEVLDEVKYLVKQGTQEVVLLGQNVNSYGLDIAESQGLDPIKEGKLPFADLLYSASAVEGLKRLRFTTSNPHDFTPQLARAFADLPKLCDSFHLPVQSGSNRILARMNRQYTREEYFERVNWIRDVRPEMAFSTDIIVGFPGETEADFEETLSLVREMKYAFIYAFKYSVRKGTPATRFKEQVPEEIKDRRLQALLALQKDETIRQNRAEIGQTRRVLILYANPKEEHTWYGRTYQGRLVKVKSPRHLLGMELDVLMTDANVTALVGHPA